MGSKRNDKNTIVRGSGENIIFEIEYLAHLL